MDEALEFLIKHNSKMLNDRNLKKLLFTNGLFKGLLPKLTEEEYEGVVSHIINGVDEETFLKIGTKIAKEEIVADYKVIYKEKENWSKEVDKLKLTIDKKDDTLEVKQKEIGYYKKETNCFKEKLKTSNKHNVKLINQLDYTNSKYLTDSEKWGKQREELPEKLKHYNELEIKAELLENQNKRLERDKTSLIERIKSYENEKEKQYNLVVKGLEDEIAKQRKSEKASKKDYKLDVDIDFDGYKPKHAKKEPIQKVTDDYVPKHAIKEDIEKKFDSIDDNVSDEPCVITVIEKNTYYNRMSRHGKSLRNSNLQQIAEILSGDYVRENGKRAWTWEQRENEIRKLYANNNIKYNGEEKQDIEEMIFITESNKYATNKHKRKLNNIYSALRAPNESKVKRFFKRNWKKVVVGGLIAATALGAYLGVKAYNNNKVTPFAKGVESKVEYISEDKINEPISVETVVNIDDYDVKENEKIVSEETMNKPVVYEVKKGDCLWNIAEGYIKGQGVRPTNKLVRDVTNIIAVENGKAKLGVYKSLEKKDKENPNLICPKEEIKISKDVENYIQEYKQKGDKNV